MAHMRMKWKDFEENPIYRILRDHQVFDEKGFSRKVSLDYDLENRQP